MHNAPGPGDPVTWPPPSGHPNDPRTDSRDHDAELTCRAKMPHVIVPLKVWEEMGIDEETQAFVYEETMECAFRGVLTWEDGYVECPACGHEHFDDGDDYDGTYEG